MAIKEDKSFTRTQIGCRSLLQEKGHGVSVSTARCLSNVLNCFIQLSKNMKEETIFNFNLTIRSFHSLYGAKKIFHSIVGSNSVAWVVRV